MRTNILIETLTTLVKARRPAYITSAPGAGKTSIVEQVAESLDMNYIHLHAPSMLRSQVR